MNYAENPLRDLHQAMAHAQYEGFSDIEYENRDWQAYRDSGGKVDTRIPARRRPYSDRDFEVYAMFTQTWGSTALGHGGMGGASMTTAYTIVLECRQTQEFLVYFGGTFCYKVMSRSANIKTFLEDCEHRNLASKRQSVKYA
jgi:hypothetical protein